MANKRIKASENFLDPDWAYFLGLMVARGVASKDYRKVVIDFPIGSLVAEGLSGNRYDKQTELKLAVNDIRERLYKLLGQAVEMESTERSIQLKIEFPTNNLACRNLQLHLKGKRSYRDFNIPSQIYDADIQVQKEFVRGFCDVAATIRKANADQIGRHRVYIDILNSNWQVPIELCALLQQRLKVPVAHILWGHPNTREAYARKRGSTWAREHQIRIFADSFLPIGFYIGYKDKILKELADANKKKESSLPHFCNPHPRVKRKHEAKPMHPEEGNPKIPKEIRGKHFNAVWKICLALGCKQSRKPDPQQTEMFSIDENEEA
jgi:hypothetical protein